MSSARPSRQVSSDFSEDLLTLNCAYGLSALYIFEQRDKLVQPFSLSA